MYILIVHLGLSLHLFPELKSSASHIFTSDVKSINWDETISILSHINGISQWIRSSRLAVDNVDGDEDQDFISVLNDERITSLTRNFLEQPDASLVLFVKGIDSSMSFY